MSDVSSCHDGHGRGKPTRYYVKRTRHDESVAYVGPLSASRVEREHAAWESVESVRLVETLAATPELRREVNAWQKAVNAARHDYL